MSQTEAPEAPAETDQVLPVAQSNADRLILDCLTTGGIPTNAEPRAQLTDGMDSINREVDLVRFIRDMLNKQEPTTDDLVSPAVFDAAADYMKHDTTRQAFQGIVLKEAPNEELAERAARRMVNEAEKMYPVAAVRDYVLILNNIQNPELRGQSLKGIVGAVSRYDTTQDTDVKAAITMLNNVGTVLGKEPGLATHDGLMDDIVKLNDHGRINVAMQARRIVIGHAADHDVRAAAATKFLDVADHVENPITRYNDHMHVLSHIQDEALQERCMTGMVGVIGGMKDSNIKMQMQQGLTPFLQRHPAMAGKLVKMADHPNPETAADALLLGMAYCDKDSLLPLQEATVELMENHRQAKPETEIMLLGAISTGMDEHHPLREKVVAQALGLMQDNDPNTSILAINTAERLLPEGDPRAVEMQQRWAELYGNLKEPRSRTLVTAMALRAARPGGPLSSYAVQCADAEATADVNIDQLFGASDFSDQDPTPLSNRMYGHHMSYHEDGSVRARANRDLQGQLHGLQVTFDQGDGTDMDGPARSVTWMEHGKIDKDRTALLRETLAALKKTEGFGAMTPEEQNARLSQETKRTLKL